MGRLSRRDHAVPAAWTIFALAVFLIASSVGSPTGAGSAAIRAPSTGSAPWWGSLALLLAQGAVLTLRRARPRAVLVAVAAAVPLGAAIGMADTIGATSLAVLVAVYTVVGAAPLDRSWPVLAAAAALVVAGQLVVRLRLHSAVGAAVGNALVQGLGAVVLPAALALFVGARRDARQARERELLAAGREREARLQAAVSHERMAMARELHDIAAHHLSGIAVMTAAIGTQIDTDPEGAKQAVAQVRAQSRTLLRDLRGLVGLLRDERPASAAADSRAQTLDGIGELVDDAGAAGLAVELTVLRAATGGPPADGVGPLAQLAAYRIVQEALANAARHAPGARTRVVLDDRGADAVRITVDNEAPRTPPATDASGGFGLVGMRERADLTGAQLEYGPAPDGGWRVALTVPRSTESDRPGGSA